MKLSNSKFTKRAVLVAGPAVMVMGLAGAAGAQTYPDPESPAEEVEIKAVPLEAADPVTEAPAEAPVEVKAPAKIQVQGAQQLPVTGGDAAGMAAIGATLIVGGGLLVWRSKGEAEASGS